jgi:hypothetical protein
MAAPVQARVQAVKDLAHGLATYERALGAAVASARSDINRAGAEFQVAVADSYRRLNAATHRVEGLRMDLARCERGCEGIASALGRAEVERQECERRVARNRQAEAQFHRTASELLSSLSAVRSAADATIPAGREAIRDYAEILTDYLARGAA